MSFPDREISNIAIRSERAFHEAYWAARRRGLSRRESIRVAADAAAAAMRERVPQSTVDCPSPGA